MIIIRYDINRALDVAVKTTEQLTANFLNEEKCKVSEETHLTGNVGNAVNLNYGKIRPYFLSSQSPPSTSQNVYVMEYNYIVVLIYSQFTDFLE